MTSKYYPKQFGIAIRKQILRKIFNRVLPIEAYSTFDKYISLI